MDKDNFNFLTFGGFLLSILFSLFLIINLNKKKSNYSMIMRLIMISECIFIFCVLFIVLTSQSMDILNLFNYAFKYVNIYYSNWDNSQLSLNLLYDVNFATYFGSQTFSMILNFFICLEVILLLRNPISQLKSRLNPYFITAGVSGIGVFFCTILPMLSEERDFPNQKSYLDLYLITKSGKTLFIPVFTNLMIYVLLVIISIVSMIFLFIRFCVGKSLLQNLKNFFVIRHCIYVIVYCLCLLPNKLNEFLTLIGVTKNFIYPEYAIILSTFTGFIMFFIRVSETNFYYNLSCTKQNSNKTELRNSNLSDKNKDENSEAFFDKDQPLTAIISRNMNMEFMCCILFGLTEIFMKPERKQHKASELTDNNLNHNTSNLGQTLITSNYNKAISAKDYHRSKPHKIRYKKIFDDNVDLDQVEVEVTSEKRKRKMNRETDTESASNLITDDIEYRNVDHDAIVIEYCPKIFRELRKIDDISGYDLQSALCPTQNKENINKIRESEGKSGSFFFFTHDSKFIIKTVTNNELNTMLGEFMEKYYEHTSATPESLLARIYGLYSIVINGVSKINIILMQNLITINKKHIKRIFDLKGSRVERITKNIEKCDKMRALKDLDYLWMIKIEEDMVDFTRDHCDELTNVLNNDLRVLRELKVMDYSLLLIITHFPKPEDPDYVNIINLMGDKRYFGRIYKSKNMKYIYILGIIDYLQKFNVAKFFENKYKSILYGNQVKYVSAVDPMIYSDRMLNFARDNIFISSFSY